MLLHQDHQFIYHHRAALQLPNHVYLDPCPDPIPNEGMVLFSTDGRAKIQINFLETDQDARSFLEDSAEELEDFHCLAPVRAVHANGLDGYTMTYTVCREIYEEYVFAIPGSEPALLDVWLEQQKDKPADATLYTQIRDELISGIAAAKN